MSSPSQAGKWLPQYELKVETAPGAKTAANPTGTSTVTITLPLTLDFEVNRQFQAQAQTANFKIKNLAQATRNLLYKDQWTPLPFRKVQLRAGYPGFMPLIFNGNLLRGYSYRESGGVDNITELECQDGQYQQSLGTPPPSSGSFAGGAGALSYAQIMNNLNADLPFLAPNAIIGSFPTVPVRTLALSGSTWDIITQLSNGLACIDNGQLKVMNENEVIQAQIPVLNADTGLLGTPRRTNTIIEVDFIFEPRLTLGQIVQLQSSTNSIFNGPYKVMGFIHRGTISAAIDGERRTTIILWRGTAALQVIPGNAVQ